MKALTISLSKNDGWVDISYTCVGDDYSGYANYVRLGNMDQDSVLGAVKLLVENAYETERKQKGEET